MARGVYHIEVPTPFAVGPVNVYLLAGEVLTLIDAGPLTNDAWQALSQGIEQIGYKLSDICAVHTGHFYKCPQSRTFAIGDVSDVDCPLSIPKF